MSFELQILLQRIALPALASILGCWLLIASKSESGRDPDQPHHHSRWMTILGTLLIAGALVISDFWQRELLWDPFHWSDWEANYRWQWLIWLVPGTMLVLGLLRAFALNEREQSSQMWPVLFLAALGMHYVALFELETWSNWLVPLIHAMLIGTGASVLNISSLHALATSGASRWTPLVLLGQLGCIAAIALQSYASLGEWVLAGIGITLGATVVSFGYATKSRLFGVWPIAVALYPVAISGAVCLLLTGYFRSRPLPVWLIGVVLVLPTIVWFLDFVYGRYGRTWYRIAWAAAACVAVLVAVILVTEPFKSEW